MGLGRAQITLLVFLSCWLASVSAFSATPNSTSQGANKEAEAQGFPFESSHDEIVARAKKEAKLRVLSSLESLKEMREAFVRKYPFVDVQVQEITGTDAHQRFLRELKAGAQTDWDVANASSDFYGEYTPLMKENDILGMARHRALHIPTAMIDPNNRNIVAITSQFAVVAYNKNLISPEKVPARWEDFLKQEFKGRKFVVDLRPHPY